MGAYESKVPGVARRYFESREGTTDFAHPVVVEVFRPGVGWKRYPVRKRVSHSALVKMWHEESVTWVALESEGRVADFSVRDLLQS